MNRIRLCTLLEMLLVASVVRGNDPPAPQRPNTKPIISAAAATRSRPKDDKPARYNPDNAKRGIPWFAMLDADGKSMATSTGPKGNIGFPATRPEIDHFVKMLKRCRRKLSDGDIEELRATLTPPTKTAAQEARSVR